ncbi:MAG: ATP-binding protein [Candidatus Deferrimicrobiota bacterium]
MRYIHREMEKIVLEAVGGFPAVVLTGPRRAGKTFLLRHLFPGASYHLFEDPDIVSRFRADPRGFFESVRPPAILDEIQNVPEIFAYVRGRIDAAPRRTGQWFLAGSQEAGLMKGVTESMAGRAAVLSLWPMSARETDKVGLLRGGYPEVLARPRSAPLWFASYLQTYLERDVRSISAIHDLATFRRFMALVASRHGQILNKSELSASLGMSVPGVGRWIAILEATAQILLVPPYFENFGKRLIKSPKIYIADSGLACHLLGIVSQEELEKSPFLGPLFEGFVASEIVKSQIFAGRRKEIWFFRDQQGLEVDFLFRSAGGRSCLIEAKATRTPVPAMAGRLVRLARSFAKRRGGDASPDSYVVHRPARSGPSTFALAPGVRAIPWPIFVRDTLAGRPPGKRPV